MMPSKEKNKQVIKQEPKKLQKKKFSRRKAIALGLTGLGGLALVSALKPTRLLPQLTSQPKQKTATKRYAMVIDLRRCIGCNACSVSCKSEFKVPIGRWRAWVTHTERGRYPNVRKYFLPRRCNHCKYAVCVDVCPTGATYVRNDGIVLLDYTRCVGCKTCMIACPYSARFINPITGVVDKCNFCYHRIDKGIVPSCVNTCLSRARIFGDLNDPKTEISKVLATNPVEVLKREMGTEPQVFYITADKSVLR